MVILLALCVLVIGLSRAAVSWKTQIEREREARMIDHARQYTEAIKRYYHSYGHYPPSMDALLQQDGKGVHYLRHEYLDPLNLADEGKFQILHYGQSVAAEEVDRPPAAVAGQQAGALGGGLTGTVRPPLSAGTASTTTTTTSSSPSGFGSGDNGIGGGPIIGVVSLDKKPGVHSFNGFDTPDHWQFVYNFASDPSLRRGIAVPGGARVPPRPSTGTAGGGIGSH
ncbi:MAG: hypothetical protein ACRETC_09820 [Gammaproteobacteria bacterium]